MLDETKLDQEQTPLSVEKLNTMLSEPDMEAIGFWNHTKASERYVIVQVGKSQRAREWFLPYCYRRTGTRIETALDLRDYLLKVKPYLTPQSIKQFKAKWNKEAASVFGKADVTLPIFMMLLEKCGEWVLNKDFENPNPQRRIQDIKETGFTLSTKLEGKKTFHMLLPFPRTPAPSYETIPAKIRKAIFEALDGNDAYSGETAGLSVLPDHKFPEIRWDIATPESNTELSVEEMREKFQLIPERINQAKREICRKCYQTGKRGLLCGIQFFYAGGPDWPKGVPGTGKAAEKGCVGCFWYDMARWRREIHKKLRFDT